MAVTFPIPLDAIISDTLVQEAIGVFSIDDVVSLCVKAKTGGVSVNVPKVGGGAVTIQTAFYLWETKSLTADRGDGVLMPDALPHWNIYSPKSPGRWFCDAGAGFLLNLRLPRDAENIRGGYVAHLHDFRGYEGREAYAPKPLLMLGNIEIWEGQTIDVTARFDKKQIDLSGANRAGGAITHYLLRFTRGGNSYTSNIIPIDNSGVDVPTHTFTPAIDTDITIDVFLLPTNVDTGRVQVPSRFFESDAPGGTNVITVHVKHYPIIGIDSSSIYQLPLYEYPFTDNPSYTEGEIVFVDGSDNPMEQKITGSGNLATRIRIRGDVYAPGKYFNFALYQNGTKVSGDHQILVRFDQVYANITFAVNLATALSENDVFTVIATEV